jgi:CHAT domain-containing protein
MANVPWEALRERATSGRPMGVRRQVARQLRTMYSGSVSASAVRPVMKALVIADPQAPDGITGLDFQSEARQVADVLRKCGIEVQERIGAAFVEGGPGPIKGVPPADLTEAVVDLLSGEFEIVHYCGHAFFDAERPDRTGWVFAGDFLSAEYLEQMRRPPLLVVANACQTTRLSEVVAQPARARAQDRSSSSARMPRDATLVAGLADQFFKQGVADYIGTGWEVSSKPATLFASEFYSVLFGGDGCTLGEAVIRARGTLYRQRNTPAYAAAWPAYQHYGNPSRTYTRHASSLRGRF